MRLMAEEVAGLAPDVILASTNSVVSATLNVTRTIPIVFTWVSDPVGSGFVANLPHPGGKITGFTISSRQFPANGSPISTRSRQGCAASPSCMFRKSLRTWLFCA
jgi:hypothetical protein